MEWSVLAIKDREAIFDYIETDSFRAAVMIDDRIETCAELLTGFPEMGRMGRVEGTRELLISGTPYIAAYCILGETVRILRVLHGARQWPEEMSEEP